MDVEPIPICPLEFSPQHFSVPSSRSAQCVYLQELMATTAALLKAMPTKLARGVKGAGAERIARALKEAQGQKLGRAVNAMKDKL